jgi:hypothetical protein
MMKAHLVIGAVLLCLGFTSLAPAQRVERAFIVSAVKIKLSTDQPAIPADDPVIIRFTITNTSSVEIPIAGEFDWIVRREDGKTVEDTPEGKERKKMRRAARSLNVPLVLQPGASSNQEETLSKLYVMNEPRTYQVSLWIEVTDETKTDYIKSNTLRITVQ